jgi:iron-sulfur cluster assembly accessory protein
MLQEIETITEQNTETITISSSAAQAVSRILAERKLEGYSLRVYVAGGGCCGANFGMALDNNIRANDTTFQSQGVQVVVDDQSIAYLRGAKIDFVNDPVRGEGFSVDSPVKNSSSCSCGSDSQSNAESSEAGAACACGGSCGCNN